MSGKGLDPKRLKRMPIIVPSAASGIPITVTRKDDPAYALLQDGVTTEQDIPKRRGCYICEDPEFAQMGLPLCRPCPRCSEKAGEPAGHVAADDTTCDDCGYDELDGRRQEA